MNIHTQAINTAFISIALFFIIIPLNIACTSGIRVFTESEAEMTTDIDLQRAIAALDEYGYDKKLSTDLEQARNKQQMRKYLDSLDYSLRRMELLQESVNEWVAERKALLAQQENIQTYKTKIINLSKELNLSYNEVLEIMSKLDSKN